MQPLEKLARYLAQGYVLHGSKSRLEILKPHLAENLSDRPELNRLAVYATNDVRIALIFATMKLDPANGSASLRIWGDKPLIAQGSNAPITSGFVQIVSRVHFKQINNGSTFTSSVPVVPIDMVEVEPSILENLEQFKIVPSTHY
ncbi:MAG TPA: hypothetical protein VD928_00665 [Candidatus Paceibacterota bacterium]|nr:hypothetical protein [Candidatus Paceibacterota bacterium]